MRDFLLEWGSSLYLPITDPVLIFALVMFIILAAPLVFSRMRIPGMVGLILAGAVVGPSALGLLERDATIILLGTVGLLYLMFVAGLSIDLNQFIRLRNQSITFGLVSFFIPLILALVACTQILDFNLGQTLLVGAVVGSHTLLAYPIVQRLKITRNNTVTMATGGTIMTDTLALSLLAVVVASTVGDVGFGFWSRFIGFVGLYVAGVLILLPRLGRWFFRYARNETNVEFVFMLAILFITAYLADLAGLAPIIGAFLAGLTINRLVPDNGVLMSRVRFVGQTLFIPFFLISVGMLVNFRVLIASIETWLIIVVLVGLVVCGKLIAAKLVQRLYGGSAAEGWTSFGLTVPQAAATLAVTLVGFEVGLFDQTLVNAVVVLILSTCIIGPWFVEKYGRQVALQEELAPYAPAEAPQRILVPLANPHTAEALMDLAFLVRDRHSKEPLFPLTVVGGGTEVEAQVAASERMLSEAVIHASAADVPVNPLTRVDMNIAGGIARAITERRISTVVIGWGGDVSGPQRVFGSVLDQLLEDSRQMVMVCRLETPISTMQRVVLAVPPYSDREEGFPAALKSVIVVTDQLGAELCVVAAENQINEILADVDETSPEVPVTHVSLKNWSALMPTLKENLRSDDLFVLLSARKGTLSWRPALDRLPGLVAQELRHPDFVILYPSEIHGENAVRPTTESFMPRLIAEERIHLNIDGLSDREVLERLVTESDLAGTPLRKNQIVDELLRNAPDHTPEIVPGAVLYHAHIERIAVPELFIGVSHSGMVFERTGRAIYVVLVLVSPKGFSASRHLQTLGNIAKMFRAPGTVDQLRSASSPEEILNTLTLKVETSGSDL